MKKYLVFAACFIFFSTSVFAQQHQLVKKWETDTLMKVPESVLYDGTNNTLYASNIDGQPGEKDGKGSIGKIALDGKITNVDWVTGLNAPKGLGRYNNTLWVADLDDVVSIDIPSGKISKKIHIDSAQFLNDLTVDNKGIVYVSDTRTKKVHRIENGKSSVYLQDLKSPNGLLAVNGNLYVLDQGTLYKAGADKALVKIADGMDASTDGVEQVNENDFLVSCWSGIIYYVHGDGNKETLIDTRDQKVNSADIGYDAKNKIVYVPTFWKNKIVAYDLK